MYTNTEYTVDRGKLSPSGGTNSQPTHHEAALTNQDVLKMTAAGLSEALILQKVQTSMGDYKLDTNDILELKKAGVSDSIISAMMSATAHPVHP